MSNQVLIFCDSYGQIKYALQLIDRNYPDNAITLVITAYPDLHRFFQVINEKLYQNSLNIIHLEGYAKKRASVKGKFSIVIGALGDIPKERRYLKEIWLQQFAKLENNTVYFISRGCSGMAFYLLHRLSLKNKLVYIHHPPPYLQKYFPVNPKDIVKLIVSKIIYGWNLAVSKIDAYAGFPYLSDKFMQKKVFKLLNTEAEGFMDKFDYSRFRVFDTGNYDVIYYDDNLIGNGYTAGSVIFKKEINNIFDILTKYFPGERIAYKYHPGYTGDKTLINTGVEIPAYIPAELLSPGQTKLHLSAFSWALAHVENGTAVSISHLITLKNDEIRKNMTAGLVGESRSKILFPHTLAEFENIVAGLE